MVWEGTSSIKSSGQGDNILLDKERYVVVVFGASCVLQNSRLKATELDEVHTSTAAPVFQREKFRVQFGKLQPQIGKKQQSQNTTV